MIYKIGFAALIALYVIASVNPLDLPLKIVSGILAYIIAQLVFHLIYNSIMKYYRKSLIGFYPRGQRNEFLFLNAIVLGLIMLFTIAFEPRY